MHTGAAAADAPSGTSVRLPNTTGAMVMTSRIRIAPLNAGVTSRLRSDNRSEIAICKRPEVTISDANVAAPPSCRAMMQKGMAVGEG